MRSFLSYETERSRLLAARALRAAAGLFERAAVDEETLEVIMHEYVCGEIRGETTQFGQIARFRLIRTEASAH